MITVYSLITTNNNRIYGRAGQTKSDPEKRINQFFYQLGYHGHFDQSVVNEMKKNHVYNVELVTDSASEADRKEAELIEKNNRMHDAQGNFWSLNFYRNLKGLTS